MFEKAFAPLLVPMELKNQAFRIEDGGLQLCCDANWTAEALLNIVKNCTEHTTQGGRIEIICEQNPLYTQIRIMDNGPGIDSADLPYIFNRFYRGRNASADSVGIGLAMSAAIIQGQGGSIAVQSTNAGSTFTIRFPRVME